MQVKIFTLAYNPALGGFDDGELRSFTADKRVHAIKDHAFVHQGVPHLSLVVTYHPGDREGPGLDEKNRANNRDEPWRKLLGPKTMPLFNSLKEWRNERAKKEGVPAYYITTNQQLAQIVHNRPDTLSGLAKIDGIGTAKLEKYGREILGVIKAVEEPVRDKAAEQTEKGPSNPNEDRDVARGDDDNRAQ